MKHRIRLQAGKDGDKKDGEQNLKSLVCLYNLLVSDGLGVASSTSGFQWTHWQRFSLLAQPIYRG